MKTVKMCCTTCPNSCALTVTVEGDQVVAVEGNTCKRGLPFAQKEWIAPERMLTSTIVVHLPQGDKLVPVKSATPMLRDKIMAAMAVIRTTTLDHPVKMGDTLIADVAGCGVSIVAAKTIG